MTQVAGQPLARQGVHDALALERGVGVGGEMLQAAAAAVPEVAAWRLGALHRHEARHRLCLVARAVEPHPPMLAGQRAGHEQPAAFCRGDAVAGGPEPCDDDVELGRAHRAAGASQINRRRSPLAASTTRTNWPCVARPSRTRSRPATLAWVISPPAGNATVTAAAGSTAARSAGLVPRLTKRAISVAVPAMISTPPTTTNSLTARSSESDMGVLGEGGIGPVELTAAATDDGQRLDRFLAGRLPQMSRSRLQALVREGRLRQGSRVIDEPGYRVKQGDGFTLTVPPPRAAIPAAEEHDLQVLYEDEHLIVLVKPAGMVVHPAPGHAGGTLVNALMARCGSSLSGIGGVLRPGIVHRLDREVSGVMVAAKHDRAHIGLAGQFSVHSVDRVYEAIVWGVPGLAAGTVDRPLGRHPVDRKRMAIVPRGGKRAVTHWRLLDAAGLRAARMEFRLETGRTHQIRVHAASLGHPILGDALYGRGRDGRLPAEAGELGRILLHARRLGFAHPVTGKALAFDVPPPGRFEAILELLRV